MNKDMGFFAVWFLVLLVIIPSFLLLNNAVNRIYLGRFTADSYVEMTFVTQKNKNLARYFDAVTVIPDYELKVGNSVGSVYGDVTADGFAKNYSRNYHYWSMETNRIVGEDHTELQFVQFNVSIPSSIGIYDMTLTIKSGNKIVGRLDFYFISDKLVVYSLPN